MCRICTALEFYLFVLVLSIINGVTFAKTHRMSFNFLSVKGEFCQLNPNVYANGRHMTLSRAPNHIGRKIYTEEKSKKAAMKLGTFPPPGRLTHGTLPFQTAGALAGKYRRVARSGLSQARILQPERNP